MPGRAERRTCADKLSLIGEVELGESCFKTVKRKAENETFVGRRDTEVIKGNSKENQVQIHELRDQTIEAVTK